MNKAPASTDRRRGALVGLAVGDALGAAVEFQRPGEFELVTGFRSGGPHRLEPGEWTDDTSMALALADSMAEVGWDLNDQARRYVDWSRKGHYSVNGRCFNIGLTVQSGLDRFEQSGDATSSGDSADSASGNGSIMRLAPVPIRYVEYLPHRIRELLLAVCTRVCTRSRQTAHTELLEPLAAVLHYALPADECSRLAELLTSGQADGET